MTDEDLPEVVEQVPPIRHLERGGCPVGDRAGVLRRAVAGDDLDAGVGAEPRRYGVGRPIRQEVHRPSLFQVDEDRTPRSSLTPSPVIDAKNPRRSDLLDGGTVDEPEDRIGTGHHPQLPEEAGTGLGSDGEADPDLSGGKPVGPSSTRSDKTREQLGECSPRAQCVLAVKPADPQPKAHGAVADGEVRR
jgi:hypothetical protein